MEAKAVLRTVRIAPRKVRLVLDLIRGKQVGEAVAILNHTPKAASPTCFPRIKSTTNRALRGAIRTVRATALACIRMPSSH